MCCIYWIILSFVAIFNYISVADNELQQNLKEFSAEYNSSNENEEDYFLSDYATNIFNKYENRKYSCWTTVINYTYIKNNLNISFIPANPTKYLKYRVSVKMKDSTFNIYSDLDPKWPSTFVTFYKLIPNQNYKIVIFETPSFNFESNCTSNFLEVFLDAYKLESLDCNNWNAEVIIKIDQYNSSIKIMMNLLEQYKLCFDIYEFQLHQSNINTCDSTTKLIQNKTVKYEKLKIIYFDNLPPGKYCFKIYGIHDYCPLQKKCFPILTNIIEIKKLENEEIAFLRAIEISEPNISVVVIISTSVGVVIIILTIVIWKIFQQYQLTLYITRIFKSSITADFVEESKTLVEKKTVPIVYARDIKEQNDVALAMFHFLKECCNVEPIIDVESAEIFMNSAGWIQNMASYECSKICPGTTVCIDEQNVNEHTVNLHNKKIIILETDIAVKLYKALTKHQILQYKKESYMNELFSNILDRILSNYIESKEDYYHLLVVRFKYSSSEYKMNIVPRVRFHIPDNLVDLYNSLWDKPTNISSDQQDMLLKEWETKPSYQKLKEAINAMENFVSRNPQYQDALFVNVDNIV